MRFIVDLYRGLLLLMCGLMVVLITVLGLEAMQNREAMDFMALGLGIIGGIGLILVLGITATIISIHDRHCELVVAANRIANAIEANGTGFNADAARPNRYDMSSGA